MNKIFAWAWLGTLWLFLLGMPTVSLTIKLINHVHPVFFFVGVAALVYSPFMVGEGVRMTQSALDIVNGKK